MSGPSQKTHKSDDPFSSQMLSQTEWAMAAAAAAAENDKPRAPPPACLTSVCLTIGCSHPPPTSPFVHRPEESGEGVAGGAVLASNGDLGHSLMIYMVSESSLMLQFFPCPVSTHVKFALDFGSVRLQLAIWEFLCPANKIKLASCV